MSIGCGPQYVINVLSQIVLLSPCVTQLNCQTQCDGFQAQGLKVLSTEYSVQNLLSDNCLYFESFFKFSLTKCSSLGV